MKMWPCKLQVVKSGYRLDVNDNNKKTSHFWRHLLWVVLLTAGTVLYFIDLGLGTPHRPLERVVEVHQHIDLPQHAVPAAFVVDNPGCRIPAMDPFDPLIQKYIKKEPPLDCAKNYPQQLFASNLTAVFLDNATLPDYNISDVAQLECCYRPFWRVDGNLSRYMYGVDDKTAISKTCTPFDYEVIIQDEFVKVECQVGGHEVYSDYYAFTPLKPEVEELISAQESDKSNALSQHEVYSDYYAFTPLKPEVEELISAQESDKSNALSQHEDSVSVLVIGIDAVSRLNFHRQMPKTEALLREMQAVEMLGYNKVGDNTFPNLVPVLTGLTEEELQTTCWQTPKTSFDDCPFLWNNFSDAGYRTAFGEDAPWMGIFSYLKVGFVLPPTDYYMRPYSKTYEDAFGHSKHMNAKLCIRSRLTAEVLLEYASKFAYTMASKRSFGFFWEASLTHDYLNYPRLGDAQVETVLRHMLTNSTALNRTVLVLMSDHGIRWGPIRETYQGRLEERLPLLTFTFPPWFRERYSEAVINLRRNTRRLTTPFDLHYTLADLIDLSQLGKTAIQSRTRAMEALSPRPRGASLFLPVSNSRTCADAGVLPHWCTCQQSQVLALETDVVKRMAQFLIKHLNRLLLPHPQCSKLHLMSVHDARLQSPVEHISNHTTEDHLKDYVLIVQTQPGNGLFEATIRQRTAEMVKVAGTVSRINTYGDQSACVADYHMKLYCYCN